MNDTNNSADIEAKVAGLLPSPPVSDEDAAKAAQKAKIRELNDLARTAMGIASRVVMTPALAEGLTPKQLSGLREAVEKHDNWHEDSDPHQEHDFGVIYGTINGDAIDWTCVKPIDTDDKPFSGHKVFWKIDYYDRAYQFGSETPWDTATTARLLTIMRASDY